MIQKRLSSVEIDGMNELDQEPDCDRDERRADCPFETLLPAVQ